MLTIACGDVWRDRSVLMTYLPAIDFTSFRYTMMASLTSSLSGIILPDFPLLAESSRHMARPTSPCESFVIHQVKLAISLALRPALTERRKISRFLVGCLVFAK